MLKIIKIICCAVLCIFSSYNTFCQEENYEFEYTKEVINEAPLYHLDGPYSVSFGKKILIETDIYEREISTSKGNYTLVMNNKEKAGRLISESGEEVAYHKTKGKTVNNLIMSDGTVYTVDNKSISKQWTYAIDGKRKFSFSYEKVEGQKLVKYRIMNPDDPNLETAIIFSHLFAVDYVRSRPLVPILSTAGVVVAIISGIMSGTSNPDPLNP